MKVEQDPSLSPGASGETIAPGRPAQAAEGYQQRHERGRAARRAVPRGSHAEWAPAPDRPDPVDLLEAQTKDRLPDLVPIRYARMMASPFAFMRGSAIVMANDLASTPRSGIQAQLCGDAHLLNFGMYASPERALLFDLNDFDETLPGPWEWDVKRLAASFVLAGRDNGFDTAECRKAAQASVASYRQRMAEFSEMGELEVWYSRIGVEQAFGLLFDAKARKRTSKKLSKSVRKAHSRDSLRALSKLTRIIDGRRMIIDDPPLLVRIPDGDEIRLQINAVLESYKRTLQHDRRHLLDRYRFVDAARKVVGVGSVGTRAYVVLLEGRDEDDPLFLQVKEAGASVLGGHVPPSAYEHHGQRVVAGQRLMQAASDIFLGWFRGPAGRDFYWRQLRDMKGSAEVEHMSSDELVLYAGLCGWALARAHARSGDRVQIAAYLGKSERFDSAIAAFAEAYADQTERNHAALCAAVKSGRVAADPGASARANRRKRHRATTGDGDLGGWVAFASQRNTKPRRYDCGGATTFPYEELPSGPAERRRGERERLRLHAHRWAYQHAPNRQLRTTGAAGGAPVLRRGDRRLRVGGGFGLRGHDGALRRPPKRIQLWGSFHFLSVGLAVGAAYLVGAFVPSALGWPLGAFAATVTYLMAVGF
jgi:uncharacterized protein (DUF2252 family)